MIPKVKIIPPLKRAIALLKGSSKNLAKQEGVTDVLTLRAAVRAELVEYYNGQNPLTPKQVENLQEFMNKTRDWVKVTTL